MDNQLLVECDVLYVDHLAVTTASLHDTLRLYLSLPGARLVRGPGENPSQKVCYAFVQLGEGMLVEILSPLDESPVASHMRRGGGAYHFCFAVREMARALAHAVSFGARIVSPCKPDPAFDGRGVAFLYYSPLGLFEFVEAFPVYAGEDGATRGASGSSSGLPAIDDDAGLHYRQSVFEDDVGKRLQAVFRAAFPSLNETTALTATYDSTPGWDSLMHLQLICQVEMEFGVSIPADVVGALTSYERFLGLLSKPPMNREKYE